MFAVVIPRLILDFSIFWLLMEYNDDNVSFMNWQYDDVIFYTEIDTSLFIISYGLRYGQQKNNHGE